MAAARSIDWIGLGITDYCRNENVQSVSRLARFGMKCRCPGQGRSASTECPFLSAQCSFVKRLRSSV